MSPLNRFRHQQYPATPDSVPTFQHLSVKDTADYSQLHTHFGISRVLLVHGTFMGDDPFAISETLNTLAEGTSILQAPLSSLADRLQDRMKSCTAEFAKDVGNYIDKFQERFQQLVGEDPLVRLMEPSWSGQNHHLARADLAVRLLCWLDEVSPQADQSVLLWGHSHAGNGFAILSNLLANDRASVEDFFDAAQQDKPHWNQARQLLRNAGSPHRFAQSVRIVAFGTPVRYGWDSNGFRDLIHVLNQGDSLPEGSITTKPMFPPQSLNDMVTAEFGDWIQAFGIAGTDIVPPTSSTPNERLERILQNGLESPEHGLDTQFLPSERIRNVCARWKTGTRCHKTGQNLLVNYEPCGRKTTLSMPIEQSMLGHGVATTVDWLPAHLALVMKHLSSTV